MSRPISGAGRVNVARRNQLNIYFLELSLYVFLGNLPETREWSNDLLWYRPNQLHHRLPYFPSISSLWFDKNHSPESSYSAIGCLPRTSWTCCVLRVNAATHSPRLETALVMSVPFNGKLSRASVVVLFSRRLDFSMYSLTGYFVHWIIVDNPHGIQNVLVLTFKVHPHRILRATDFQ